MSTETSLNTDEQFKKFYRIIQLLKEKNESLTKANAELKKTNDELKKTNDELTSNQTSSVAYDQLVADNKTLQVIHNQLVIDNKNLQNTYDRVIIESKKLADQNDLLMRENMTYKSKLDSPKNDDYVRQLEADNRALVEIVSKMKSLLG